MGEMDDYRSYHDRQDYERNKEAVKTLERSLSKLFEAKLLLPTNKDVFPRRITESLEDVMDMVVGRIAVLQKAIRAYEED